MKINNTIFKVCTVFMYMNIQYLYMNVTVHEHICT